MTIQSRLLSILLPLIFAFVILISLFFYFSWSHEIIDSFRSHLNSISSIAALSVNKEDINEIVRLRKVASVEKTPAYDQTHSLLEKIKRNLPIQSLSVVLIEPIKEKSVMEKMRHSYQQIYLLDVTNSKDTPYSIGKTDFIEWDEDVIYLTKDTIVTPIYYSAQGEKIISAYSPIINNQDQIIAYITVDANIGFIDKIRTNALKVIITSAIITLILLVTAIYVISEKLTRPFEQLSNQALAIAAGNYNEKISIKGPKEIQDLSNSMNTMSECLKETLNRLKDASETRTRLYGEYEGCEYLQELMFQEPVKNFSHPYLELFPISLLTTLHPYGFRVTWDIDEGTHDTLITISESNIRGMSGMYKLLTSSQMPTLTLSFREKCKEMTTVINNFKSPIIWSSNQNKILNSSTIKLESNDLILVYNEGLSKHFENHLLLMDWFHKILYPFAKEEFSFFTTLLSNKIGALDLEDVDHDIFIMCMKII